MERERIAAELDRALAAGLILPADRDRLEREALAADTGPLQLLLDMGLVSEETLARLDRQPSLEATVQPFAGSAGKLPEQKAFPVANWERYQWRGFLGQGGMGRVFLAYDPRLMRQVAIKFLREEQAGVASRLVREARAQARVQHDRVCKVYEVEEIAGKVYIAMQYIEGRSLAQLGDLGLAEKIRLVREAAEGVHAAHDAGLIHRDIKPGNIMVAQVANGPSRPYVMDFGLAYARDEDATQTHGVGTPHFMAPEQALGKENLDPRCDVYALGATLYWALTGSPPVTGANSLEVLARIPTQEPVKPWQLNVHIPRDLGLILLKALAKDPGRRYGSAAALAEDLARFTRGEAVEARGGDTWYQVRKAIARHKLSAAVLATAALLAAAFLLSTWHMRRQAVLREGYIREFTREAEEIEARVRYMHMMPLHDTRGEKKRLAAVVAEIEREMKRAGPLAANAGHYALGRGLLALDRPLEAQRHLETAWNNGFDDPPVAYALARVLGARYREGVVAAGVAAKQVSRETRFRDMERRFRDPALRYLEQVPREGSRQPDYLEALVAYYGGDHERALAALARAHEQAPWFYETHLLEGDVICAQGQILAEKGEREAALALFRQSGLAYERAARLAASDVDVYLSWANLCGIMVRMALYGGGELEEPYRQGLALLEKAQIADPDDPEIPYHVAYLHSFYAEYRQNTGGSSEALLEAAIAQANLVLDRDPEHHGVHRLLGHLHNQVAMRAERETRDPRPALHKAIAAFERVAEERRNADYYQDLGNAFQIGARYELAHGLDPSERQARSIDAFRRAIALNPDDPGSYISLGVQLLDRARQSRGDAKWAGLEEVSETFTSALARHPGHMVAYYYLGQAYHHLGVMTMNRGDDPRGFLDAAIESQRAAAAINDRYPHFPQAESIVWYDLARYRWRTDGAWADALAAARSCARKSLAVDDQFGHAHLQLGLIHVQWADYLLKTGADPTEQLATGVQALARAETMLPNLPEVHLNRAMAYRVAAANALARGRSPADDLMNARRAIAAVRAINPEQEDYLLVLAQIEMVTALWRARAGSDPEPAFREAACWYGTVLQRDPGDLAALLAFANARYRHAVWLQAAGRPFDSEAYAGLDLAAWARSLDGTCGEALALQGATELLLAGGASTEDAVALCARGRNHLRQALRANGNLAHRWGHLAGAPDAH